MKKILDVVGIVIALLLSLELVIMLVLTPIAFSALSLMNGQTVVQLLDEALSSQKESQPSAEGIKDVKVTTLSVTIPADLPAEIPSDILDDLPQDVLDKLPAEIPSDIPIELPTDVPEDVPVDTFVENVGKEMLEKYLGNDVSQEQITAILSTNTAKELLVAYAEDLTNTISGNTSEPAKFTTETVKTVINKNIDEVVEVLQTVVPEYAEKDVEEIKTSIQEVVEDRGEEIIQSIPQPEEVKQHIAEANPAVEQALHIIAMKNTIELIDIGIIFLLSALVFVCRLKGFKGFRWVATDLFIAGGLNAIICVGLRVSASAVNEIAKQAGEQIAGIIGSLLHTFTDGMIIRTAIMLASGVVLLAIYLVIKKHKAKKRAIAAQARTGEACA